MFILLILSVIILFIDFQHYIYDWTTSCAFFTVWPKDSQIAVLTLKIKMWPMSELTTYQMSMAIIKAGVKKWRGSKRLSEVKRSKADVQEYQPVESRGHCHHQDWQGRRVYYSLIWFWSRSFIQCVISQFFSQVILQMYYFILQCYKKRWRLISM